MMNAMLRVLFFVVVLSVGCLGVPPGDVGGGDGGDRVRTVDFLFQLGLDVNGAGPLLVATDEGRNRVVLVNTNTSSVSLVDGANHQVTNIPVKNRVPQYLKSGALTIDHRTGNIYVVGNKSLHMVFPEKGHSLTVDTGEQYEMVAVNEVSGHVYLVGRASKALLMIDGNTREVRRIPFSDRQEPMVNLNQTPPPPIRKVVCDHQLQRVYVLDGFTAQLYIFAADTGKLLKVRPVKVKGGARWHMAGYNQSTHHLYVVVETRERKVIEALKIAVRRGADTVVPLPGLTEGVGINYNPDSDQVYIPYDNHPTVHLVDFKTSGVHEIQVPTYGNDATAIDRKHERLYVASWAYGEVAVIDLEKKKLLRRIRDVGIIPHMFSMTFNPNSGELFIPLGASAVNGSFGAALTVVDPDGEGEPMSTIYTGWAPVALVEMKDREGFLVFSSEDQVARVMPDGTFTMHSLPSRLQCRFVNNAVPTPSGTVYVSYGPHQSYWPTVYIWAAKNGILGVDPENMGFYDRRIPRMAQQMAVAKNGALYALQNNWGKEKQFLISLPDEVRSPNQGDMRVELEDTVERETTQRILEYDPQKHWLYIVRTAESDGETGILQIYDIEKSKTLLNYPVGVTPTHLVFDEDFIYVSNFDADTIARVRKADFSVQRFKTGAKPFKMAFLDKTLYCINHNGNSLQAVGPGGRTYELPDGGRPSNVFSTGRALILTTHTADSLRILKFNPASGTFDLLHRENYPYGETTVDTDNSAFYMRGQFADGIFELNRIKQDRKGRLWITDYLSGKLFILSPPG